MTAQIRNDEMKKLLEPEYFGKNEPNMSWVHYPGAILSTCGLQGFWPMSAAVDTGTYYARDIATGINLTQVNGVTFGYLSTATVTALPPWAQFVAASSMYFSTPDNAQHDILGTETYISANERGLTVGGWFKFDTLNAGAGLYGLISKWYAAGLINDRAYRLYKNAANNIVFEISSNGTAGGAVSATSTATVTTGVWYHLYGRFKPATSVDVFVDNVKTSTVAGVPASVFDSTEPFQIGRTSRANYHDGKASMCHINAAQLSDAIINVLWEQSRVMYGREG